MIGRIRVAALDVVKPLGRFQIAFELLVPDRVAAKVDVIGLQHLFLVQKIHLALGLVHHDAGDRRAVVGFELGRAGGEKNPRQHNQNNLENPHLPPARYCFAGLLTESRCKA